MYVSISTGNWEDAKKLCKCFSFLNNDEDYIQILDYAIEMICKEGVESIETEISYIKFFIEHGARNFNRALIEAVQRRKFEIVKLLIDKGADNLESACDTACFGGHIDTVKYLMEKGACDYNDWFYNACFSGNLKLVNLLIEKGGDNWNAGLRGACNGGRVEIAELMMEKGADDYNGGFSEAYEGMQKNTVILMIKKGATNIKNYYEYPRNDGFIIESIKSGVPIKRYSEIKNYDLLCEGIEKYQRKIFEVIEKYIIPDLTNIVSNFCL